MHQSLQGGKRTTLEPCRVIWCGEDHCTTKVSSCNLTPPPGSKDIQKTNHRWHMAYTLSGTEISHAADSVHELVMVMIIT
jgi:hypothetical protein